MKNREEKIDSFFTKGLANYGETPSPAAWGAIKKQLPAKSSTNYWVAASVAAVLIASTIVWNNILNKTNSFNYETASTSLNANYPKKEFVPFPIIIYSTRVVYIENKKENNVLEDKVADKIALPEATVSAATDIKPVSNLYTLDTKIYNRKLAEPLYTTNEPIIIIYKKGDPKHPKLAKATSFLKQVSEGERPLIDFEKISTGLLARRETFNNSNK